MPDLSDIETYVTRGARFSVVYVWVLCLFGVQFVPVLHPAMVVLKAPLFLIVIYYWAIYRPTLLPVWSVFALGCIVDLLTSFVLGFHAGIFVIVQMLVQSQRRVLMTQNFIALWLIFFAISLGVSAVTWGFHSVISAQMLFPQDAPIVVFAGLAVFPLIYWTLHLTHKLLPGPPAGMSLKP